MIDPSAKIDPKASVAKDVKIGAYSVIGPDVSIDSGCEIGPHVVIQGPTSIGKDNKFFQFASIGADPQDKKYQGAPSKLSIGDRNTFRECTTINRGTFEEDVTQIGSDNLFMAYVHIAHDCIIGNHIVLVNSATIAGHVEIGDYAIISAFCAVHQFCKIGQRSFISHASLIAKDVPPYVMITGGSSPSACGLNAEGLRRAGYDKTQLDRLKEAYKILYRRGYLLKDAIAELQALEHPDVALMVEFLKGSKRGIVR